MYRISLYIIALCIIIILVIAVITASYHDNKRYQDERYLQEILYKDVPEYQEIESDKEKVKQLRIEFYKELHDVEELIYEMEKLNKQMESKN